MDLQHVHPGGLQVSLLVERLAPAAVPMLGRLPEQELKTASAAKLLVLLSVAEAIETGRLNRAQPVDRAGLEPVGYAGLWHHFSQRTLAISDLAKLVGSVSDNLATNALIREVGGVGEVMACAARYGVSGVYLHDIVRQHRTREHPAVFSSGTARGYVNLLTRLWVGSQRQDPIAVQVLDWIADSMDTDLVAHSFNIDPLSHSTGPATTRLFNKTGSDAGVRTDCGLLVHANTTYVYCVIANWDPEDPMGEGLAQALAMMRRIGHDMHVDLAGTAVKDETVLDLMA